ncbi:MAG TPA: hypothetical protein VJQ26_05150, partial [Ktedonobacteraceae bacterium]|nr:hypothetical protein [Ktedonobacteraceae bacterium]
MTRNCHVRFGERSRETRLSQGRKVRSAPTLFSPLLANIALHGFETVIRNAFPERKPGTNIHWKPIVVRYADDFVVM